MTHSQTRSGFSLMELMVYMAIVGMLAAVIGPRIVSYLSEAKKSTSEQTLRNTKQAIELYFGHVSRYPEALRDLANRPMDEKAAKKWRGPYLEIAEDEELEDGWGNPLYYEVLEPGSGKPYMLYSYGASGEGAPEEEWIHP